MKKIVIATQNQGKVKEIAAAFADLPIEVVSLEKWNGLPAAVEDGATFTENALIKARHYATWTKMACLADDSGLEVDALGGAPGVYSARFAGEQATDEDNNLKLLGAMDGVVKLRRTARFRCVIAYVDPDGVELLADGVSEGEILTEPAGNGGFGYDPLFFLPKLGKSMAELTLNEKNSISHRGKALKVMRENLAGILK